MFLQYKMHIMRYTLNLVGLEHFSSVVAAFYVSSSFYMVSHVERSFKCKYAGNSIKTTELLAISSPQVATT